MAESTVRDELRKYSALAWTLVVTLVVSVALFVQFARMDRENAIQTFSLKAEHAVAVSGMRMTQLIERLEVIGREHLTLKASELQLLSLLHALDMEEPLDSLCTREGDTIHVLLAPAEGSSSTIDRCMTDFSSPLSTLPHTGENGLATDLRIIPSSIGKEPSLEVRIADGSNELRATISTTVLLDILMFDNKGLSMEDATVCLSLYVDGGFQELTCRVEEVFTSVPEVFSSMAVNEARLTHDVLKAGMNFRVTITPHLQSLGGTITLLPLIMFGVALAIGTVACVLTYRTADKNIRIEAHSEELRRRLDQVGRLEEQNSLLDQFASMAAHDLQAPIRFIVSNAYLLISELEELDQPELSEMAQIQIKQGERMRELVLDLLEFCRAGQSKLDTSPVNTRSLVNEEVRLLKAHKEFDTTEIVVGSLPDRLICDANKLAHIVRNLLGNAVKFSQVNPAPKVSISASRNDVHGEWTFCVKDNGPGIGEEYHELVFRPFARLDSNASGTGMGLAIVKIMLERHGGRIYIDSTDTEGSTFCFTMPGAMPARTA